MKKIAVLLTCFNRKNKTLACLRNLFKAYESCKTEFNISVYLTNDGCSDGTADAVLQEFPDKEIHILAGTGFLYWAGGMRNSWKEALKEDFDGYLLLNDDTHVYNNVFKEIFDTHCFCRKKFNQDGIYIGTTCSQENLNKVTYGGSLIVNRFKATEKKVIPNGKTPQLCDCGNANIMYVTFDVVKKIGILHESFTHAFADYDYTLLANKMGIPVMITSNICGICDNEHPSNLEAFFRKSLRERIKYTYSPLGFALPEYLIYMKRNYWYRLPFVAIAGWIKILLPAFYLFLNKKIR